MRNSLTYELDPGFRRDDGILVMAEKNTVIPAKAGIHGVCKRLNRKCSNLMMPHYSYRHCGERSDAAIQTASWIAASLRSSQ
jgi:hypothetical protein